MPTTADFDSFIEAVVREDDASDRPIFAVNLDDVWEKVVKWKENFPRVNPFYAMKCNDAPDIIRFLAKLGLGFDCASIKELLAAQEAGVTPERIVFANPCKTRSMLRFARANNVKLTTFDSEAELEKIAQEFPGAEGLIRLKVDDLKAKYRLSDKFGVTLSEVQPLLSLAQQLRVQVVGVAFHIGSDNSDPSAFSTAILMSRDVSELLPKFGFEMHILDIGGGFPGDIDFNDPDEVFFKMAHVINQTLNQSFPLSDFPGLNIIAEPGRYFVSSAFRLITKIIGKRTVHTDAGEECMYYLNDGLFGGFLIKFWEPELIKVKPLVPANVLEARKSLISTIWGPTCDSSDCIIRKEEMKELEIGEHLVTDRFGAYTVPLTTPFNQMEKPVYRLFSSSRETVDERTLRPSYEASPSHSN